jgi:hypothetical protein
MVPGAAATTLAVPVRGRWLLGYLGGEFTLLAFGPAVPAQSVVALAAAPSVAASSRSMGRHRGRTAISDTGRYVCERYDGRDGTCYLFGPTSTSARAGARTSGSGTRSAGPCTCR